MAQRTFVPVGHVFEVFPAHDEHDIILGIDVETNPFGTRHTLVIQNPEDTSDCITVRVQTLEFEKMRTNVAQVGHRYGVKPLRHGSETLIINPTGWLVFVTAEQAAGATQRQIKKWPRPPRFKPPSNQRQTYF